MKIGILQCDSVLPQYQEQFGDYPSMFIRVFRRVDLSLEFTIYPVVQGIYPMQLDECDAYITTGSKDSVYDPLPWLKTFKDFLRQLHVHKKKLVGICFGHQLIADLFGGKTTRSEKGWGVGVACTRILESKAWMSPAMDELNIIVSHRDQVIRLPPDAILVAGNDFCPNFMFQLNQSILCTQGHPEFSKQYADTMMNLRRKKIGEETYTRAQQSLELEVHDRIVAQWILNFMAG